MYKIHTTPLTHLKYTHTTDTTNPKLFYQFSNFCHIKIAFKSGGYKKIYRQGKDAFAGLSQNQVSKAIMENKDLRKYNVKLTNKARPRPVRAKGVPAPNRFG